MSCSDLHLRSETDVYPTKQKLPSNLVSIVDPCVINSFLQLLALPNGLDETALLDTGTNVDLEDDVSTNGAKRSCDPNVNDRQGLGLTYIVLINGLAREFEDWVGIDSDGCRYTCAVESWTTDEICRHVILLLVSF